MFALKGFSFGALFGAFILIFGAYYYSYCMLLFYMFITMFRAVDYFITIELYLLDDLFFPSYRSPS